MQSTSSPTIRKTASIWSLRGRLMPIKKTATSGIRVAAAKILRPRLRAAIAAECGAVVLIVTLKPPVEGRGFGLKEHVASFGNPEHAVGANVTGAVPDCSPTSNSIDPVDPG